MYKMSRIACFFGFAGHSCVDVVWSLMQVRLPFVVLTWCISAHNFDDPLVGIRKNALDFGGLVSLLPSCWL